MATAIADVRPNTITHEALKTLLDQLIEELIQPAVTRTRSFNGQDLANIAKAHLGCSHTSGVWSGWNESVTVLCRS